MLPPVTFVVVVVGHVVGVYLPSKFSLSPHISGLQFYRAGQTNTKILTVFLSVSAHVGSTDSLFGRVEWLYDRAPREQPIDCRS